MITEDFLLQQGFIPPSEFDTTWSLKLDSYSAEPVFNCDSVYIEVCTEMQNIRIHRIHCTCQPNYSIYIIILAFIYKQPNKSSSARIQH